jgi:hypothetical protein
MEVGREVQSSVGTYQAPETMLIVVPDGAAQRYPAQFGQRWEPTPETQVEGVDGDAETVRVGIVEVVVVVVVAVAVAVAVPAAVGVIDSALAATTMLKARLVLRWPAFAVTRNWTMWRSVVELAEI